MWHEVFNALGVSLMVERASLSWSFAVEWGPFGFSLGWVR